MMHPNAYGVDPGGLVNFISYAYSLGAPGNLEISDLQTQSNRQARPVKFLTS